MVEGVDQAILAKNVPYSHRFVPRACSELATRRTEAEARYGSRVPAQYVDELRCLEAPYEDVVRLVRACANYVTGFFDGQACELGLLIWLEGPKILVLDQIKGPDGAIG